MITCQECNHQNPDGSEFCEACGTKLRDPRKAAQEADAIEADFMLDQVKKARSAFLVVGVLAVLGGLLGFAIDEEGLGTFVLVIQLVLAGVFFGLAWWCSRQPFAAAVAGLAIFSGLHGLNAIVDPSTLYQGIIIKIIVIVVLVRAVQAGIKHREFVRSRGIG